MAATEAISSARGKAIQTPYKPMKRENTKAEGGIISNDFNKDTFKESIPWPKASKAPQSTIEIVDTTKPILIMRRADTPTLSISGSLLNKEMICVGRAKKSIVPKNIIIPVIVRADLTLSLIRL